MGPRKSWGFRALGWALVPGWAELAWGHPHPWALAWGQSGGLPLLPVSAPGTGSSPRSALFLATQGHKKARKMPRPLQPNLDTVIPSCEPHTSAKVRHMTKLKSREVWKCSPHIRRGNRSKGQWILRGGKAGGGLVTNLCPILVTPWTVAREAPLSLGFPRLEYQSGLTFLLQGIFPTWE